MWNKFVLQRVTLNYSNFLSELSWTIFRILSSTWVIWSVVCN